MKRLRSAHIVSIIRKKFASRNLSLLDIGRNTNASRQPLQHKRGEKEKNVLCAHHTPYKIFSCVVRMPHQNVFTAKCACFFAPLRRMRFPTNDGRETPLCRRSFPIGGRKKRGKDEKKMVQ